MSYSVCIKCGEMVPGYEKFCDPCTKRFLLRNDPDYHRKQHTAEEIAEELKAEFVRAGKE